MPVEKLFKVKLKTQIATITEKRMKKTVLMIATLGITFSGIAQEKYVVSANVAMKSNNYEEAKENIDKAMANPETSSKPKALLAKAQIYYALQNVEKYRATNPYREAAQALFKLVEVDPNHQKPTVDQLLLVSAFAYYNDGVRLSGEKKFQEAADLVKNVVKIHDLGGGKRFEKNDRAKSLDTVSAAASIIIANTAYYSAKYDEAIPLLTTVKNNPISRSSSAYYCLIDAYTKQKNSAEALATINEARKFFPDDVTIRNAELNYYVSAGKQDELLKKLEEAGAKEPGNAEIQFYLASTYQLMANPKDGKKPANATELATKSEDAFIKALKADPDNAGYNYNFGALIFNQANDYIDQMNNITGSTDADTKKYKELEAKRNALFEKSAPYFEKAYSVLAAKESQLKAEDKTTYKSTMMALKEVYARQNKMDKSNEMKKKYESTPK